MLEEGSEDFLELFFFFAGCIVGAAIAGTVEAISKEGVMRADGLLIWEA